MSEVEPGFQLTGLDFRTRTVTLFLHCSWCVLGILDGKPARAGLGTQTKKLKALNPSVPALSTLVHQT